MFGLSWGSKDTETEYIEKTEQLTAEIASLKHELKEHKQLFEQVAAYMQKQEQSGRSESIQNTTKQANYSNSTAADSPKNHQDSHLKDSQKSKVNSQAFSSPAKGKKKNSTQGTPKKSKRKKQPQSGKTFNPSKYLK